MDKGGIKLKLKIGSTPEPPDVEDGGDGTAVADAELQDGELDESAQENLANTDAAREKQHKRSKKKKRKREREKDKHRHKRERLSQDDCTDETSVGCSNKGESEESTASPEDVAAALKELLSHLLKQIEKRDTNQFFVEPVTDAIAPGYSSIITQPMCFAAMRDKVNNAQYETLHVFEDDVKLMVANCLKYNGRDTVYYTAGKKLLTAAHQLITRDKLRSLKKDIPGISLLSQYALGMPLDDCEAGESGGDDRTDSPNSQYSRSEGEDDDGEDSEEEAAAIAEQTQQAARGAALKLRSKKPTSTMGYLQPRPDGSMALKFLSGCEGAETEESKPLNMGLVLGKLTAGSATLHNYHDDKRTMAKPVRPIHYGSYSSFCPSYDSTFSNLSKEESDLVRATYGNDTAVQYSESICEYSRDCNMATTLVDQLLNLLTNGQHSRTRQTIIEHRVQQQQIKEEKKDVKPVIVQSDMNNLRSLSALGIDTSFLDTFEQLQHHENSAARQLSSSAELVTTLAAEQSERLSKHSAHSPGQPTQPTQAEMQLAERLTSELVSVARSLPPSALLPAPMQ